jgi:hypothetical protein
MKKVVFLLAFFFLYNLGNSQLLTGSLIDEGRKMTSKFDFNIKGKYQGFQVFELTVNALGEVTSVKLIETKDALISTPAKLIAVKELYKLKFDGATYFPKFQHARIRVNYLK